MSRSNDRDIGRESPEAQDNDFDDEPEPYQTQLRQAHEEMDSGKRKLHEDSEERHKKHKTVLELSVDKYSENIEAFNIELLDQWTQAKKREIDRARDEKQRELACDSATGHAYFQMIVNRRRRLLDELDELAEAEIKELDSKYMDKVQAIVKAKLMAKVKAEEDAEMDRIMKKRLNRRPLDTTAHRGRGSRHTSYETPTPVYEVETPTPAKPSPLRRLKVEDSPDLPLQMAIVISDSSDDDGHTGAPQASSSNVTPSHNTRSTKRKRMTSEIEEDVPPRRAKKTKSAERGTPQGSVISDTADEKRFVDFDKLYVDDKTERHHSIFEFPAKSDCWYIVKCEEHGLDFKHSKPYMGAVTHLREKHGIQSGQAEAVKRLGYRILGCTAERARKNNEDFRIAVEERGYKVRGCRTRMRNKKEVDDSDDDYLPDSVSEALHPVAGELYMGFWQDDEEDEGEMLPIIACPLSGDVGEQIGVPGVRTLEDLGILQKSKMPKAITFDKLTKEVKWAPGYEDGGQSVARRRYPVCWVSSDQFQYGWLPPREISQFDFDHPDAAHIPEYDFARNHFARLKGFASFQQMKDKIGILRSSRPESRNLHVGTGIGAGPEIRGRNTVQGNGPAAGSSVEPTAEAIVEAGVAEANTSLSNEDNDAAVEHPTTNSGVRPETADVSMVSTASRAVEEMLRGSANNAPAPTPAPAPAPAPAASTSTSQGAPAVTSAVRPTIDTLPRGGKVPIQAMANSRSSPAVGVSAHRTSLPPRPPPTQPPQPSQHTNQQTTLPARSPWPHLTTTQRLVAATREALLSPENRYDLDTDDDSFGQGFSGAGPPVVDAAGNRWHSVPHKELSQAYRRPPAQPTQSPLLANTVQRVQESPANSPVHPASPATGGGSIYYVKAYSYGIRDKKQELITAADNSPFTLTVDEVQRVACLLTGDKEFEVDPMKIVAAKRLPADSKYAGTVPVELVCGRGTTTKLQTLWILPKTSVTESGRVHIESNSVVQGRKIIQWICSVNNRVKTGKA